MIYAYTVYVHTTYVKPLCTVFDYTIINLRLSHFIYIYNWKKNNLVQIVKIKKMSAACQRFADGVKVKAWKSETKQTVHFLMIWGGVKEAWGRCWQFWMSCSQTLSSLSVKKITNRGIVLLVDLSPGDGRSCKLLPAASVSWGWVSPGPLCLFVSAQTKVQWLMGKITTVPLKE